MAMRRKVSIAVFVCVGATAALVLLPRSPLGGERGAGAVVNAGLPAVSSAPPPQRKVSALGRLEPEDGLIRLAGPSGGDAVIAKLLVDDGDPVEQGQLVAVLDTVAMIEASVSRLEAELGNARRELERHETLNSNQVVSDSLRDGWNTRVRVAEAELAHAHAELDRVHVRSPVAGRVIEVHAREGERVTPEGIMEIGRTDRMFAIAEVYEDDIARVAVGQRARISSPALGAELSGRVEQIHLKVAVQDALGTDPAARKDARVVEVEIRLDDSVPAAGLTNLQVEIEIET